MRFLTVLSLCVLCVAPAAADDYRNNHRHNRERIVIIRPHAARVERIVVSDYQPARVEVEKVIVREREPYVEKLVERIVEREVAHDCPERVVLREVGYNYGHAVNFVIRDNFRVVRDFFRFPSRFSNRHR